MKSLHKFIYSVKIILYFLICFFYMQSASAYPSINTQSISPTNVQVEFLNEKRTGNFQDFNVKRFESSNAILKCALGKSLESDEVAFFVETDAGKYRFDMGHNGRFKLKKAKLVLFDIYHDKSRDRDLLIVEDNDGVRKEYVLKQLVNISAEET